MRSMKAGALMKSVWILYILYISYLYISNGMYFFLTAEVRGGGLFELIQSSIILVTGCSVIILPIILMIRKLHVKRKVVYVVSVVILMMNNFYVVLFGLYVPTLNEFVSTLSQGVLVGMSILGLTQDQWGHPLAASGRQGV